MPARASVQVLGIKEALKELNDFDKQYRRQVKFDIDDYLSENYLLDNSEIEINDTAETGVMPNA